MQRPTALRRALTGAALGMWLVAAAQPGAAVASAGHDVPAPKNETQFAKGNKGNAPRHGLSAKRALPDDVSVPPSCDGDGTSGKRVQILYVRGDRTASRFGQLQGNLQAHAAHVNGRFVQSSEALGGHREVRFLQDPSNCAPVLKEEVVPQSVIDQGPMQVGDALEQRGYRDDNRKYLTYAEIPNAQTLCGLSWNGRWAMVGLNQCFFDSKDADVHELLHTFGAVQSSAPYATSNGHCYLNGDLMCYDDGGIPKPPGRLIDLDPDCHPGGGWIDCTHDSYFNPNPRPGGYLASGHLNVADIEFLIRDRGSSSLPSSNALFTNVRNGWAMDVDMAWTADGTKVKSELRRTDDAAERWNLQRLDDGRYLIRPVIDTGKALDANNDRGRTVDGTSYFAQIWGYGGGDNQKWTLRPAGSGGYEVVAQDGGCLTGEQLGSALGVWKCTGADNQHWKITTS
ncbi:RICIN domain-containing protein [Streptomyces sp. NPDC052396]|uniref:RICIN domain-containing protein n=1 Tax=Streptomyces sp. NPDC052396 TaxID=3365689 RepID=UPI0037CE0DC4